MSLKASLKYRLEKWPALYGFLERIYFTLQPVHLRELVVGTGAREREWAKRHLRKGNDWGSKQHIREDDEWVLSYWDQPDTLERTIG